MPTTTNYSWTTPADTDLVKDGASAIRTLGSSIDTTTKNLNPSTTLGDIEYRSSTANTNTRLAIGTTGQVLTVSGGVPAWGTVSSGGLTLLSTTTLSGASTTISSISQDYNNLQIVVQGVTINTNNRNLRVAPNSSFNSSYTFINTNVYGQYASGSLVLTGDSVVMDRTNANNIWVINYVNYASSTRYKPFHFYGRYQGSTGIQTVMGGGTFDSNTAISSWLIDAQGTDTFAGGTVLIYGVK